MTNRLKYRLKGSTSEASKDEDTFIQVGFGGERRLLPVGEINHIVDVGEEFNKERNKSSIYRLQGTVCPLFSNPLMNIGDNNNSAIGKVGNGLNIFTLPYFLEDQTGSQATPAVSTTGILPTFSTTSPFTNDLGYVDLNYEESFNKYLIERDGWFGVKDPNIRKLGFSEYFDIEPTRDRFDLNSDERRGSGGVIVNVDKNWELTITYPFDSDDTHHVVLGGLLIVSGELVSVGGKDMVAIGTSTQHGLENGDRVTLSGMSSSLYDGEWTVKRLGLDNGDYQANYFAIDINPTPSGTTILGLPIGSTFGTGRMRKLVSGEPSKYYLRKFKKILVNDDYEMYPLGFSNSIFTDQNYQFIINEDIDVNDTFGNPLVDNLGRPLSELYATFVKTDSGLLDKSTPGSKNVFGHIKSGLDLEDIGSNKSDIKISNVRQIHDGPGTTPFTSHTPLPGESDLYGNFGTASWYYGDVVEYNRFTLKETVLANVLHRFNTTDRETPTTGTGIVPGGPRREGYLYNPHHLFRIREFSLYIEQGDELTDGIPNYAEYMGPNDGRHFWRDLLDIGFYDGEGEELDYPFTNGAHYIHQNLCFMTTRQDPFGHYGLYYPGKPSSPDGITPVIAFDPPDPRGDAFTDKFTTKKAQDVC